MAQEQQTQQQKKLSTHLSNIPHELRTGPGIFHVDDQQGCYVTVGGDGKIHKRPIETGDPLEQSLLQQWEALKSRTGITPRSLIYSHRETRRILRLSFMFAKENLNFVAMEEPGQPTRTIGWFEISNASLNHGISDRSATSSIELFKHLMTNGIPQSPNRILSHQELSEIQLQVHPESLAGAVMAACSRPLSNRNMAILQETGSGILPTHWYEQWLRASYDPATTKDAHLPTALVRQLIEHPEAAIYEGSSAQNWRSVVRNIDQNLIDHAVELGNVPDLGPERMAIRKAYRDEVLARNPSIPDVIEVSFYGSGDDGSVENIWPDIEDADFQVKEKPCLITDIFSGYALSVPVSEPLAPLVPKKNNETGFEESLREIVYQILDTYYGGWENDAGSQGTVGIYLKAEHPYAEILDLEDFEEEEDEEEEAEEEEI